MVPPPPSNSTLEVLSFPQVGERRRAHGVKRSCHQTRCVLRRSTGDLAFVDVSAPCFSETGRVQVTQLKGDGSFVQLLHSNDLHGVKFVAASLPALTLLCFHPALLWLLCHSHPKLEPRWRRVHDDLSGYSRLMQHLTLCRFYSLISELDDSVYVPCSFFFAAIVFCLVRNIDFLLKVSPLG